MSRQPENGVQFSVTKSIREEAEDERRLLDGGVKISPGELRGAGRGRIDRHDVGRRDNGGTDGDRRVRACVELVASRCARMRRHGDDGRHGRLGRREPRDADAGREDKDAEDGRDARCEEFLGGTPGGGGIPRSYSSSARYSDALRRALGGERGEDDRGERED